MMERDNQPCHDADHMSSPPDTSEILAATAVKREWELADVKQEVADPVNVVAEQVIKDSVIANQSTIAIQTENCCQHEPDMDLSVDEDEENGDLRTPDVCQTCNERFASTAELAEHERSVHNRKVLYECEACNTRLESLKDVLDHAQLHQAEAVSAEVQQTQREKVKKSMRKPRKQTGDAHYVCSICGDFLSSLKEFITHRKSHSLYQKCTHCPRSFTDPDKLTQHEIDAHRCATCGDSFTHLDIHMLEHIRHIKCRTCDFQSNTEDEHERHIREAHPGKHPYQCDQCDKPVRSLAALSDHEHVYSTMCHVCGLTLRSDCLDRHIRSVHERRLMHCVICQKFFTQSKQFSEHMMSHYDELPFECDACLKQFRTHDSLLLHQKFFHENNTENLCPQCGRAFSSPHKLDEHMAVHIGDKPHVCQICGKGFFAAANLRVHERLHTGERSEPCPSCSKTFSTKYALTKHVKMFPEGQCSQPRSRTNVSNFNRRYPCEACGKSFTSRHDLRVHSFIHGQSQGHPCTVCKKAFSTARSRDLHLMQHTGEKPLECELCGRGFIRGEKLKVHLRAHQSELASFCRVCGHCFANQATRNRHEKQEHGKPAKCDLPRAGMRGRTGAAEGRTAKRRKENSVVDEPLVDQ